MQITYALEPDLSAQAFREILVNSTLAKRRPANELERPERMLRQADIIVTARHGGRLVGISRAITDFAYCCYLSDLAVDVAYQRQGIGERLIHETRARTGECYTLVSRRRSGRRNLLSQNRHEASDKLLGNSASKVITHVNPPQAAWIADRISPASGAGSLASSPNIQHSTHAGSPCSL